MPSFEVVRAWMQSGDAECALVVGDGRVILVGIETFALRKTAEGAYRETFERLAIFVGDLPGNDAFGSEFENRGHGVGTELEGGNTAGEGTGASIVEIARLARLQRDGAFGEAFQLEFAFGVCESCACRIAGEPHESVRDRLAGDGIYDGAP